MSERYFIHATPTLFNAGTCRPQMSSCFLVHMKVRSRAGPGQAGPGAHDRSRVSNRSAHVCVCGQEDSIEGIFDTLKTCACISKYAGGIGVSVHNIRATKSHIRGTNGSSNGLVPMLKVFSDTARYACSRSRVLCESRCHTRAAGLLPWGQVRGPGRRKAQGLDGHLPGAVARGHRW